MATTAAAAAAAAVGTVWHFLRFTSIWWSYHLALPLWL